jgi:hypothetical protein
MSLTEAANTTAIGWAASSRRACPPATNTISTQGTGLLVVRPDQVGSYLFRSFNDDGSRLRIDFNIDGDFDDDGELVIYDDVLGPHYSASNSVTLSAGHLPIEYSFYNYFFGGGGEISASNLDVGGSFLLEGVLKFNFALFQSQW